MSDLATYRIETSIAGMKLPGQKEGLGDRELTFSMNLDPEDGEAANEVFYTHLEVLLGPDNVAALKAEAQRIAQGR